MCGIVLKQSTSSDGESTCGELKDEELENMLAKDLSDGEKEEFKVNLRKHSHLFISNYYEISGVTMVEHHINLKPNCKPGGPEAKKTWYSVARSTIDGSEEATTSWLHLSNGRFRVGVPCGGDPKEERQVVGLCGLQAPKCSNKEGPFSSSFSS